MSLVDAQSLVLLVAEYERAYGKIHPRVRALPERVQLELIKQARQDEVVIDEALVEEFLSDTAHRLMVIEKVLPYLRRARKTGD